MQRLVVVAWIAELVACERSSTTQTRDPDRPPGVRLLDGGVDAIDVARGELPAGAEVRAAGEHAGGLWFAGTNGGGWLMRIERGTARSIRLPFEVMDAAATPSGDIWVTGVTGDKLRIVRVARDGSIGLDRAVEFEVSGQTYDLVVVEGGVVAVGMHNAMSTEPSHGWLIRVGDDGAVTEHRLSTRDHGFLAGAAALRDGAVAAVGQIDGVPALVIMRRDGSIARRTPVLVARAIAVDVASLAGDVVVLGFSTDIETGQQLLVERRGSDGKLRWSRRGDAAVAHISEAIEIGGEVVALASSSLGPGAQLTMIRVTGDGKITTQVLEGDAMSSPTDIAAFPISGDRVLHVVSGRLAGYQILSRP